ncbi:Acyl-coenzyme A thioesterase [Drechslerella dactyloides]|uniref:Acyl-coenzyme A thioesterase n=1 Tax=Drechslerella dactyloides TaxID=74499 RepID=A0AAD6J524_DREDA|nr:Acyl-coenzyme A thioesterase [Drechslerella dactyloides]
MPVPLGEFLSIGHSSADPSEEDDLPTTMPDSTSQTIKPPPPPPPHHSLIESTLELTALTDLGPTTFTNTRPLWRPPNARGIFGGAVIAQSLAAAIRTVPDHFRVHSMHCYFVLAGDWTIPVVYTVELVRDGRSFATRTVQARQQGRCIFTTTCSFQRPSEGKGSLEAQEPLPEGLPAPEECDGGEAVARRMVAQGRMTEDGFREWQKLKQGDPFERRVIGIANKWCITSYETGVCCVVIARFGRSKAPCGFTTNGRRIPKVSSSKDNVEKSTNCNFEMFLNDISYIKNTEATLTNHTALDTNPNPTTKRIRSWIRAKGTIGAPAGAAPHLEALAYVSDSWFLGTLLRAHKTARVGMMVSLDHTIYFHGAFRADEWMFLESDSPWAGDQRGLVHQRICGKDGRLIATCYQEGLVRVRELKGGEEEAEVAAGGSGTGGGASASANASGAASKASKL